MKIIEAGHIYDLETLDGYTGDIRLTFVKRVGENFPFNAFPAHGGTNVQEVLRALINRNDYLYDQKPCAETECSGGLLRAVLTLYELRAGRRHGRFLDLQSTQELVNAITCRKCKHVGCDGSCH